MTIKDIAARCGVSVSTVSRALNGHPDVSAQVREQVMRVVRETHYVPNSSARDLVRQDSDGVGLVVRGVGNQFFAEILSPMEERLIQAGFTPVLHQIRSGEDELKAGAALAKSKRLKGLIFLGGCFNYGPDQIAGLDVPFVCCTYTNSFGSLRRDQYSSVTIDDRQAGRDATDALLSLGHRRIAVLLDEVGDSSISELRYLGYADALSGAGIEVDPALVCQTGAFDMDSAYWRVRELLAAGTDFTAIFAISDAMALAAIRALYESGRRVPEDCSVVGIDGLTATQYTIPILTSLVQPKKELGEQAADILVEMIQGRAGNRQVVLPTTLRRGESVRAC